MNSGTPNAPEERASASGLLRSIALYVEARGRLLHIEGQEAGARAAGLAGMFIFALVALIIGWMLAAPAVVWIIAEKTGWHWTHVALAGGGSHLFVGLLLIIGLKHRLRSFRPFEESFQQLSRDREWLAAGKNK